MLAPPVLHYLFNIYSLFPLFQVCNTVENCAGLNWRYASSYFMNDTLYQNSSSYTFCGCTYSLHLLHKVSGGGNLNILQNMFLNILRRKSYCMHSFRYKQESNEAMRKFYSKDEKLDSVKWIPDSILSYVVTATGRNLRVLIGPQTKQNMLFFTDIYFEYVHWVHSETEWSKRVGVNCNCYKTRIWCTQIFTYSLNSFT